MIDNSTENPAPDSPQEENSRRDWLNPDFKRRSWSPQDHTIEVSIPLYHHHNVVIIRTPRELTDSRYPHLEKVFSSLQTAITDTTGSTFATGGAISYLSSHTRMMTQPLLYSTLQTNARLGSDITRASYYHDSFDSKTLFIITPYDWDVCLGAKLHNLVDQTYLTYQNLLIVSIWEPSCGQMYSTFPLASFTGNTEHEHVCLGMIHDLDKMTIPQYNLDFKTLLNLVYYIIITMGTERTALLDGTALFQHVVTTHLWSPLGYQERHKVFLDDTQIR